MDSKEDLLALTGFMQGQNMKLYPQVKFLNIFNDSLLDDVSISKDMARRLDRLITVKNQYNLATYQKDKILNGIIVIQQG